MRLQKTTSGDKFAGRASVDDTVDIVTEDGFYIRMKPLVITHRTAKSSQKQEIRSRAKEIILKAGATSTWVGIQKSIMDGSLSPPSKMQFPLFTPFEPFLLRKTQLIQSGVTVDDGPTLEEIRAERNLTTVHLPKRSSKTSPKRAMTIKR